MLIILFLLIVAVINDIKTPLFSISIDIPQKSIIRSVSLQSLLHRNQVQKVHLVMGHLIHRQPNNIFPSNNIAHIYSKQRLSQTAIKQIASIFGVSQSSFFALRQPELNLTTISDPNDRFCMQNFQTLVRQFLPCKNWVQSGLQQLYGIDKLFKGFIGMQFVWQSNKINFKIVAERQKKTVLQSFEKTTACGIMKQSQYDIRQDYQQLIASKRFSLSKWYYPQKTIAISVCQTKKIVEKNSTLSVINKIPAGFDMKKIVLFPEGQQFESKIQVQNGNHLVYISLNLPLLYQDILIHISFSAGFPPIQRFQSIAGGGQEIMGLTRIITQGKIHELLTNPVTESLLQPDFSIAFKSITGGVAIILIVWLTLWRNHQLNASSSIFDNKQ